MDMLNHVVCKQFGDDAIEAADELRNRMPGECVDAHGWRNLRTMLKHNFVDVLPERTDPVPDTQGRWWADEPTLLRYKRTPMGKAAEAAAGGDEGAPAATAPAPPPPPSTPGTAGPATGPPSDAEPSYKPEMFKPNRWRLSDGSVVMGKKKVVWALQLELEREGAGV